MKYHAKGIATRNEYITVFKNPVFKNSMISLIDAPFTFLIPISLTFSSEENLIAAKSPITAIKIERMVNTVKTIPNATSEL